MGMIDGIRSVTGKLVVLVSLLFLPLGACAGIWDQLSADEQRIVRERLVDELGKMLNEGKVNENLQFTAQHIGTWATYAGEIVEGNFDNAINATMKYAADQFLTSFETELGARIEGLENSALSFVYTQVISHKGESREIARLALNGDFSAAGNIAWETAKKDVQQHIQTKTEETLKFAFNWVFDGAKIGSYTPADIFLEVVRIERIIIPEIKNYLTNTQLQQILEIYKKELAESGGNHNAAWIMVRDSHIPIKAHSVSRLNMETLRQALEQCSRHYSALGQCIGDVQSRFENKLAQERQRSEVILKQIAEDSKARSREGYKDVQELIQRIIAEHSKDYKDAISEAMAILGKLQTQAQGIMDDCAAFYAKKDVVDQAQEKVKQANIAAAKIRQFLKTSEQCKLLSEAPQDLDTLLQQLKTANNTFEGHMQSVTSLANEVCQDTGNIGSAFSKSEGKKLLDQAISKQEQLNQLVSQTESSAALVRRTAQEINESAASFKVELSAMDADIGTSDYLEEEKQQLNAAKSARKGYDAAVAAMKKIAERLKARRKNMDEANPVELSGMEQVEKVTAGGINKAEKVRTAKLLKKYEDFPEVEELLARIKEADSQAECAYTVARQMRSPDQAYEWKNPRFSDEMLAKLEEAKSHCQSMPGKDAFDSYEQQASTIANDMEAKELPWIPQKQAERCMADGLVAYQSLVDPAAALSGSVEQLEKVCGNARTVADRASHTASAAVQAGESLTNALVKQLANLNIADTLAACSRLDEIKSGVMQSAATAKTAAANAQNAAAKGSATAQSCISNVSVSSIDSDLASIEQHQYDAVIAYGKAQEGDDLFDRIIGAAKQETARIQKAREGLSQLLIYREAIKDHMKNARSDKEAAFAGFKNCKAQQADLSSRASALAGNPDDKVVPGLIQRINSVTTEPGPELTSIDSQLENAGASLKLLESADTEADAAIVKVQTECLGKTTAYADVLSASQAILTIEDLRTKLIHQRDQCLASLGAKSPDSNATAGGTAGVYSLAGVANAKSPDSNATAGGAEDKEGPVVTPPPDIAVEATGPATPVALGEATAIDSLDGELTAGPDRTGPFEPGTHTILWSATDSDGNTSSAAQTVTVTDSEGPRLEDLPGDITRETESESGAAASYGLPTASDRADPNPKVSCTPPSGTTFPVGSTVVTCTATDASGNTSSSQFTVTVAKAEPPCDPDDPACFDIEEEQRRGGLPGGDVGDGDRATRVSEVGEEFQRSGESGGEGEGTGGSSGGAWGSGYREDPAVTGKPSGEEPPDQSGPHGDGGKPPRGADAIATMGTSGGAGSGVFGDGDAGASESGETAAGGGAATNGTAAAAPSCQPPCHIRPGTNECHCPGADEPEGASSSGSESAPGSTPPVASSTGGLGKCEWKTVAGFGRERMKCECERGRPTTNEVCGPYPGTGEPLPPGGATTSTAQASPSAAEDWVVYTMGGGCWGALHVRIAQRAVFDGFAGEGGKLMLGGFASEKAANDWICSQFTSRPFHYWCRPYPCLIGDQSYICSALRCDWKALDEKTKQAKK